MNERIVDLYSTPWVVVARDLSPLGGSPPNATGDVDVLSYVLSAKAATDTRAYSKPYSRFLCLVQRLLMAFRHEFDGIRHYIFLR